jgi:signal transduction histidine kinase
MTRDDKILQFSALATVRVSHDLQNLLAIMTACSNSLAGRSVGVSRSDRDFAELNEAIDSAFRLTRELAEAVGMPRLDEPVIIDLHELLARCTGMIERLLGPGVRLALELTATQTFVQATAVQLEWILLNLAANGRDAMPNGGVVRIETASIDRWTGPQGARVRVERFLRLSVRDTGPGIADDVRARLFEPFFTTKAQRSGLGLTSVAVTVRALKGWLYVESPDSGGTSVHVLLPLFSAST